MVKYKAMRVRICVFRAGLILTAFMMAVVISSDALSMSKKQEEPAYAPGEVLVSFNDGVSQERIEQIVSSERTSIRKVIGDGSVHLIVLPEGVEVADAMDRFSAYPEVKYAEPNYKAQRLEK